MSTAERVIDAIGVVTGEFSVRENRDLALFEHNVLDSLRTVELLVELADRFHTDIALTEIDRDVWATPNRIVAFMENRVGP